MAMPWLRILDAVIGVTDLARSRRIRTLAGDQSQQLETAGPAGANVDARLAGVVVAALKEAFDRDSRRLDLERERAAIERERAERAMRLELRRLAGDREIVRLRLLAGAAIAGWMATLFFSTRLLTGGAVARALLGGGWLLLLAAVAASFVAQRGVAAALDTSLNDERAVSSGVSGALALWLIVVGLALIGVAVLIG